MTAAALLLAQAGVWRRFIENDFYHYALAGGVAIALLCGVLSTFVVLKRMALIGQGISHAAFGGAGVALLAALVIPELHQPLLRDAIIALFCVGTALLIGVLSRRGKLTEDTSIGIFLAAAMALGVLLIDLRAMWLRRMLAAGETVPPGVGYTPSIHEMLFGNILFAPPLDVCIAWGLAIVVTVLVVCLFKELVLFTFDDEAAKVLGVRTGMLYYGLLVCLGLAVVAAMRSLGVILAGALLVLPGACARYWARRIGWAVAISALIAVGGVTVGLFLAIWFGRVSPAPVIVLTLFAAFVFSYIVRPAQRIARRRRVAASKGQHENTGDH